MTVTNVKRGAYIIFEYEGSSKTSQVLTFKPGDVFSVVHKTNGAEETVTGRLAEVGDGYLNMDISTQYEANVIRVSFAAITSVEEIETLSN